MTTISATSYTPYYPTLISPGTSTATTAAGSSTTNGSATTITLSDAAKAAMNLPDFSTVVAQTRSMLDQLLADGTKPADADLSKLDRRQLFAISSNAQGQFTADEQAAAKTEQQNRLDSALAGPNAVARVTDDIEDVYTAALGYLDAASPEEKATPTWTTQRAALVEAQKQMAADPSKAPQVDGDIVADYIQRTSSGDDTSTLRDFNAVASDARAALDKQYADAKAAGKQLVFSTAQKTGQQVDFSQFDSRSLSAVALNQGNQFSAEEVSAAKQVMNQRSGATILAGLQNASSSDPGAFAKNLLSAYASMSPEERAAAGWSDKLYAAAAASYKTASQLSNLFGSSTGTGTATTGSNALSILDSASSSMPSLADVLGGDQSTDGASTPMTLADLLGQTGS